MSNLSIKEWASADIMIKDSQFIGYLFPISSEQEAIDGLAKIRAEHPKATHHCSAYLLGDDDHIQRAHDDGEPSQTAGVPMLEVLKKNKLHDVSAVVVRYFGGTKLGAGGLIRAYTKGVTIALDAACLVDRVWHQPFDLTFAYSAIDPLDHFLKDYPVEITNRSYLDQVTYRLQTPLEHYDKLVSSIHNFLNGQEKITPLEKEILPLVVKRGQDPNN
ncbi:YigZ family protein [Atopobacter sp. AH10]|uniref:YigZ family protein n=1 Tax=Atopobacter sp. AH10 TaxID=2315861 RepID=UPI000EF1CDC1|nr:YigZ family protein [Atopobacter sp. AH10]RLK62569.1 YigZ family protein [Atopobacter sp. AH10]